MTSQVCQNLIQYVSLLLLLFQIRNKGDFSLPSPQARAEHIDCYTAVHLTAAQKTQELIFMMYH